MELFILIVMEGMVSCMKVLGIVAEYDPFHNGHLHHIVEAKKKICPDLTYIVLSPCVKQRGELSLLSPVDRARCALQAGADAVFSLPVLWTVRDAEHYALGAVSLLSGLGVTHLAFGGNSGYWPSSSGCRPAGIARASVSGCVEEKAGSRCGISCCFICSPLRRSACRRRHPGQSEQHPGGMLSPRFDPSWSFHGGSRHPSFRKLPCRWHQSVRAVCVGTARKHLPGKLRRRVSGCSGMDCRSSPSAFP